MARKEKKNESVDRELLWLSLHRALDTDTSNFLLNDFNFSDTLKHIHPRQYKILKDNEKRSFLNCLSDKAKRCLKDDEKTLFLDWLFSKTKR